MTDPIDFGFLTGGGAAGSAVSNRGTWIKLVGSYVVTQDGTASFGVRLPANKSTSGNSFFVDDMAVREWSAMDAAMTADDYAVWASASNCLVMDPEFTDVRIRRHAGKFTPSYTNSISRGGTALKLVAKFPSNLGFAITPIRQDDNPANPSIPIKYPISGGMTFIYDMWVYANGPSNTAGNYSFVALYYEKGRETAIGVFQSATTAIVKGQWQQLSGSFTIPVSFVVPDPSPSQPNRTRTALTSSMIPGFNVSACATGDEFIVDRCFLYR